MDYLKKELNKLLPISLLLGGIGGVLLILMSNLFTASIISVSSVYILIIGGGVYILNHMRYRKDTISSILYGYLVYAVMTVISFIDTLMNTNQTFYNPLFEHLWVFLLIFIGVLLLSGIIATLFKRNILQ